MKNITPAHLRCTIGACAAVYDDGDDVEIIGSITDSQDGAGSGECRVRISKKFFENLFEEMNNPGGN